MFNVKVESLVGLLVHAFVGVVFNFSYPGLTVVDLTSLCCVTCSVAYSSSMFWSAK